MTPLSDLRLRTDCSNCINKCCSEPYDWVYLTTREIERLEYATGLPAAEFVDVIENPAGFRLRVLNLPCRFLDANGRCSVYEARPLVCRVFPFYPEPFAGTATLLPAQCGDNLHFVTDPNEGWALSDHAIATAEWLSDLWREALVEVPDTKKGDYSTSRTLGSP